MIPLAVHIDNLTVIMFLMVTFIATLIHIYSMGYMNDDPGYPRFFTYLSLFCFSMLGLVASANVFMVFIFWELVGVCSYLLIGFWYEGKKNSDAANKAFIVNRVGDIGMLIGLGLIWTSFGTFDIHQLNRSLRDETGRLNIEAADSQGTAVVTLHDPETGQTLKNDVSGKPLQIPFWALTLAGLGIFAGCVGKSAQFPLHVWLPDAMAGPTPVSALIHAATMVAAGVYLVGRFFPLFTPDVQLYIAYTGGITSLHRGHDRGGADRLQEGARLLDREPARLHDARARSRWLGRRAVPPLDACVLQGAFVPRARGASITRSTPTRCRCSVGCGEDADHSLHHACGERSRFPGCPCSADFIRRTRSSLLRSTSSSGNTGRNTSCSSCSPPSVPRLTAFYMFRMWFLVFAGTPRGYPAGDHGHGGHHDHHQHGNPYDHALRSPPIMTWPLMILAVPTIIIGYPFTILPVSTSDIAKPVLERMLEYGEPVVRQVHVESIHQSHLLAMGASILILAVGVGLGILFYAPPLPYVFRRRQDARIAAGAAGGIYKLPRSQVVFRRAV